MGIISSSHAVSYVLFGKSNLLSVWPCEYMISVWLNRQFGTGNGVYASLQDTEWLGTHPIVAGSCRFHIKPDILCWQRRSLRDYDERNPSALTLDVVLSPSNRKTSRASPSCKRITFLVPPLLVLSRSCFLQYSLLLLFLLPLRFLLFVFVLQLIVVK